VIETLIGGLIGVLALGPGPAAGASAADSRPLASAAAGITVEATGECPSQDAVLAALLPAIGRDAPAPRAAAEPPRVVDLGDRFEVTAFGQTRQYADAGRDCTERARVAAVFITLALNPPELMFRSEPPARPPTETANRRPVALPSAPGATASLEPAGAPEQWFSLAVNARLDGPMDGSSSTSGVAAGVELHATAGWRRFGVTAGAGVLTSTESTFSSVAVRQQRFPLSLTVTARRDLPRGLVVAGAAGVALVPFTLHGDRLGDAQPATRLDTGARVAFAVLFPGLAGRATPFLGLHAEYFPRPYTLDVGPVGEIGTTARFWLGASLGLAFQVR
jgi:hypothetical protein